MRLTVFIGSPKEEKSNTMAFLGSFLEGFTNTPGNSYELHYLARINDEAHFRNLFATAECTLFAFPLYVYFMPSLVKEFFEYLAPLCKEKENPKVTFFVQSGFPEAFHSRDLERYLKKLAMRLHSPYLGTIIKGNCEGSDYKPKFVVKKTFNKMYRIGEHFGRVGEFDNKQLANLAKPEKFVSVWDMIKAWLFVKLANVFFWDKLLKTNKVYSNSMARPYEDKASPE